MSPNIGLSDGQRQGVIQMLTPLLADEYVLYTKTHNYHWNVVGRSSMTCMTSFRPSTPR